MHTSFRSGSLPKISKISQITPVFKIKGNAEDVNNYRPISVTSVVFKLLEKNIVNHIHNYLFENKILYQFQSGFQAGELKYIIIITILSNLDKGKEFRFVFWDISKAFEGLALGSYI